LGQDPSTILFLNVNSFLGGARDVWNAAKGKIGLFNSNGLPPEDLELGEQKFNDGAIEMMTYSGPWAMGLERLVPGRGYQVGQFNKPVVLDFKEKMNEGEDVVTYTQIDGEFFKVIRPRLMKIELCRELPNGKLKLLIKKEKESSEN